MSGDPYPVLPKHLLSQYPDLNRVAYNSQPVGTGPFIVDHWQRGQKIIFRANPHYWRGRPKLDRIEFTAIPDENTILTQLQAHEVDLEWNAPVSQYPSLQKLTGFRLTLTPFTQYSQIVFNLRTPALADVQVRRALAYATNVDGYIQKITHGVQIRAASDQPEYSWAYTPNLPRYDFDQQKARALLDAAGWRVGPGRYSGEGRTQAATRRGERRRIVERERRLRPVAARLARRWRRPGDQELRHVAVLLGVQRRRHPHDRQVRRGAGLVGQRRGSRRLDAVHVRPDAAWRAKHLPFLRRDARRRRTGRAQQLRHRRCASAPTPPSSTGSSTASRSWCCGSRAGSISFNTDLQGFRPAHTVTDLWNSWEWSI